MRIATSPTRTPNQVQSLPQTWARRRWTGEELDRLMEQGFIREGSSTFLWDGEIIDPAVEEFPHYNAVESLRDLLADRLPSTDWTINRKWGIDLGEGYRPQPDLTVGQGPRSNYQTRGSRPRPGNVALLIEVSDGTYDHDSGEFLRKYAEVGISQYWIVNIGDRRIEVYTDPDSEGRNYRKRVDHGHETVVPLRVTMGEVALEFRGISVKDVFKHSLDPA
jgi:Uma2 family endonuclease